MILKKLFIIALASASLIGCGKRSSDQEQHPSVMDASHTKTVDSSSAVSQSPKAIGSIRDSRKAFFRIPKNVDKDLFVVAFYNEVDDCPEAIIYNDAKKKSASKITYFADGTTARSELVPELDGSFREIYDDFPEDKPHYVVYPGQVKFVHTNGSVGATFQVLDSN